MKKIFTVESYVRSVCDILPRSMVLALRMEDDKGYKSWQAMLDGTVLEFKRGQDMAYCVWSEEQGKYVQVPLSYCGEFPYVIRSKWCDKVPRGEDR